MSETIQIRPKKNQAFNIFAIRHVFCLSIVVYVFQWLFDTCGPLSSVERHTNSNCLECLAHGRVCFWGFMQEQVSSCHMAIITRMWCIFLHNYSAEYEYTIKPTIQTE